ncbi:AfsR/SARP family transcriptional regulator [Nocardiopsis sp. FIRDI 009]|uniref:AfsR/SARP family transcriptional regulator n=1 Tax=Nocardiopsis sp. FIRDI 009 TaxID=714197 RepID=UPI000E2861DF|nr:AfsR/SARP family transcriptional regulator [Nocardiopsis sp. FIRDI 009]
MDQEFRRVVFRLLGTLEVLGPDGPVRVPPGRQQTVLSALLLELDRVVSTDHLVDVLWEHDPPETARTQVQICVSRLRRLLGPTGAVIDTQPPGYRLRADETTVDAHLFRVWVRDAEVLSREGRDDDAVDRLRDAVGLWRGPALTGVEAEWLRARAVRLNEERLDAVEAYLDVELRLGRHTRLVGEIPALLEEHPLRERLRAQLMLALYRSGRQAEALQVYRAGRELLVEELGLEPSAELRALEAAILNGDPELDVHDAAVEPAPPPEPDREPEPSAERVPPPVSAEVALFQLPTAAADFVGRADAEKAITDVLLADPESVGIAILLGRPGVGKSATAVHTAHRLAGEHFPDAQLYCDLRGTRETPVSPSNVLGRFLRALGVPGPGIPDDLDERAAMYRALLASRRVLVVLDDAASEAQVAPLIPGGGGSGVVVTSRARLTGVPGAHHIDLDILSEEHALALLARVAGADRVEREPEAASALVRAVGRLPLALRIVAARLAARPHWTLAAMVTRLSDERRRLDELAHGDMTVRASLSLTYDGLDEHTARVFGLLGAVDGPTIPAWSAGALLDDDHPFPADLAEPLVDTHMLDVTGVDSAGEPVYRFHDLVREYAREKGRAGADGNGSDAEVRRLVGGWLFLMEEANRRVFGENQLYLRGDGLRWSPPREYVGRLLADPHRWIADERANLLATISRAAEAGLDEQCWELVTQFGAYAERRGHLDEFEEALRHAVRAVRAADNRRGMAVMDLSTGVLLANRRRIDEARSVISRAFSGFVDLGDRFGQGLCRNYLAQFAYYEEDGATTRRLCEEALSDFTVAGNPRGMWRPLLLLGRTCLDEGDDERSTDYLDRALKCATETGDPRARAQVLHRIAYHEMDRGQYTSARERLRDALELIAHPGDQIGEALLRLALGRAHLGLGEVGPARELLEQAVELRRGFGDDKGVAEIRTLLDAIALRGGVTVGATF